MPCRTRLAAAAGPIDLQTSGIRGMPTRIVLSSWIFCLAILPIYTFGDGQPQIFHPVSLLLLVFVLPYALSCLRKERDIVLLGSIFVTYAVCLNTIWFARLMDESFLWSSAYWCYNFALFLLVVVLTKDFGGRFATASRKGIGLSIAIEIGAVVAQLRPDHAGGAVGTFLNPNQLGYWVVISVAAYVVLQKDDKLGIPDCLVIGGGLWLAASSLSRAALGSYALLIVLIIAFQRAKLSAYVSVAAAFGALLYCALATNTLYVEASLWDRVVAEFGRQTRYDSLQGRGYDRIWQFDKYLLFGAGQGAGVRFTRSPSGRAGEIYSSVGAIVFCYGVVGALLFTAFALGILRRLSYRTMIYTTPVLIYGLVHNGVRFSPFWIFLGIAYSVGRSGQRWRSTRCTLDVESSGGGGSGTPTTTTGRRQLDAAQCAGPGPVEPQQEQKAAVPPTATPLHNASGADGEIWIVDVDGVVQCLSPRRTANQGQRPEPATLGWPKTGGRWEKLLASQSRELE